MNNVQYLHTITQIAPYFEVLYHPGYKEDPSQKIHIIPKCPECQFLQS